MYKSNSDISDIGGQLDGNVSFNPSQGVKYVKNIKVDKISAALSLPIIASYNMRSIFPKINNFKIDMLERNISVAFVSEVWEQSENKEHRVEIDKMLEIDGLKYISTSRPSNKRGGGVAIVVNQEKFSCEKIDVFTPDNLEVVWGLLKPKESSAKFKKIIACSFYSPPNNGKNTRLADYLVSTLQMLYTRYPESGIILGADKNKMNITPILNCGLRLNQVVDKPTRQGAILDVLIMNLRQYYKSPIIVPPVGPDNPADGVPSDHSVPVCIPHTDRYNPPIRNYTVQSYRPLPDSGLAKFGQWIMSETWDELNCDLSPTELAEKFQNVVLGNLDKFCPEKTKKVGSQDKPWVDCELKRIHRQKQREYIKKGKSTKYKLLAEKFEVKYKTAAEKYMRKNIDELKHTNPGQAYSILKKMGAQPGDCTDSNTFTLPNHQAANLTNEQSAEAIAAHFAHISQEFPPLDVKLLPQRVQTKLSLSSNPPVITVKETQDMIIGCKKPKSGVPGDLPRIITKEFADELATPMSRIFNSIFKHAEWPTSWKLEYVTPIGKIPLPESEDDLRPISLTAFFSKVAERFVVEWLMHFIGVKIDFRQYGGSRGNSITHYLIEFINFILSNQDKSAPTAILACMIDFSKAFNRQNHNLLITKLSDMGVPTWLLKIVMAFLTERKMLVRYKGAKSSLKNLPGGGPQGTLLGLLLFIVLINDAGFGGQQNNVGEQLTSKDNLKLANQIHLKYVDDLTIAESINLKEKLVSVPLSDRQLPDSYHARTGHALLPAKSEVYNQLMKTNEYAIENEMKINQKKTKLMLFNQSKGLDFMPDFTLSGQNIELVEETKLLGVTLRADLKWSSNTETMVKKANKRIWILRRLKNLGASLPDLIDVYTKQIRSVLELAVPVWHSSITQQERTDIERVQKSVLHVLLGDRYTSYEYALTLVNLESLELRREKLCLKFAKKAEKNDKHQKWFEPLNKARTTRQKPDRYCNIFARTVRFEKSPIFYLTTILNKYHKK